MLKVVRHHHNNIEEVYPINGIYKVYELDTYELEYSSDYIFRSIPVHFPAAY